MNEAFVVRTAVTCSIGNGAAQCSASFRAGLSGYTMDSMRGPVHADLRLALLPELDLELLAPALQRETLSDRKRRMLRLGGMALRPLANLTGPFFLALPEPRPELGGLAVQDDFVAMLGVQAEAQFDLRGSQTFALGRAGGFHALQAGLAALRAGAPQVIVGGVDTYFDPRLLAWLDREHRLLADGVRDGFAPGEAAAFLCLSRKRSTPTDGFIRAVGVAEDPGHRYGEEPALGLGLSAALDAMQWRSQKLAPVRTCFAGLNGESFGAKAWGVAQIRHHDLFDPELAFEHPADLYGDVGAATATLLLALADETLRNEQRPAPALVWAASDRAPCGAAYLAHSD